MLSLTLHVIVGCELAFVDQDDSIDHFKTDSHSELLYFESSTCILTSNSWLIGSTFGIYTTYVFRLHVNVCTAVDFWLSDFFSSLLETRKEHVASV